MINYLHTTLLVLLIAFHSCRESEPGMSVSGELLSIDSLYIQDIDSLQLFVIEKYREELNEEINKVLVYSAHVMEKGSPEGMLNNFVADLVFETGNRIYQPDDAHNIDFCLLNYGGLRISLPEGKITNGRVFELLPFENEMVVVTLSGDKVEELFNYLAKSDRGMPISGLRIKIKDQKPVEVSIQGNDFDSTRNYKVLTSDFLAAGGDNMDFFLDPLNYELLDIKVRDAIILHMQETHAKGQMIQSQLDGRISYISN